MKKKRSPRSTPVKAQAPPGRKRAWFIVGLVILLAGVMAAVRLSRPPPAEREGLYAHRPAHSLTFNKDIAPILFERCSYCHRPGQSAPFNLLTFQDVAKHAREIGEVTANGYMPPWLPEAGFGDFAHVRRLTVNELGLIRQWLADGVVEGRATDLLPMPRWPEGWQLGKPDLVISPSKPYLLSAEGKDVFHNLVIPIPMAARRYVKAVEFQPGNPRVVHHASIKLDQTRQSSRLAARNDPAGFDGMELPESAQIVAGQLLGWEPGKQPEIGDPGLSWPLEPNTDLVIQLHLHPSGKVEQVQPSLAFYFTDQPPTNSPYLLRLAELRIDIPPGSTGYSVENSYTLPVDVDVLRVSPHAHYLAKEMQGYAVLPDGTKRWLILIRHWDFNWQGNYTYREPVFLPRGTKVVMHFTFDNSPANPRNPNHPPQRTRYGIETTNEMAQLAFQLIPRHAEQRPILVSDNFQKLTSDSIAYLESVLMDRPNDARTHAKIGQALLPLGRYAEAAEHLRTAIRLDPSDDRPHYDLGSIYLMNNQLVEALDQFEAVLRSNSGDYQAHGSLGAIYLRLGDLDLAERHCRAALTLNPADTVSSGNLKAILAAKRDGAGKK